MSSVPSKITYSEQALVERRLANYTRRIVKLKLALNNAGYKIDMSMRERQELALWCATQVRAVGDDRLLHLIISGYNTGPNYFGDNLQAYRRIARG